MERAKTIPISENRLGPEPSDKSSIDDGQIISNSFETVDPKRSPRAGPSNDSIAAQPITLFKLLAPTYSSPQQPRFRNPLSRRLTLC